MVVEVPSVYLITTVFEPSAWVVVVSLSISDDELEDPEDPPPLPPAAEVEEEEEDEVDDVLVVESCAAVAVPAYAKLPALVVLLVTDVMMDVL